MAHEFSEVIMKEKKLYHSSPSNQFFAERGCHEDHELCFAQLHILLLRKNRCFWKTLSHARYAGLLPHEHQDCQFFSAR